MTRTLRRRGDGLYGEVETAFRGIMIETGAALRKTPGAPVPGSVQTGG